MLNRFRLISFKNHLRRCYSTPRKTDGQESIRNIGILAHIDAGKTTTTERMLFYSGKIKTLGEVHHGTTVTDFLAQERERGITICSSAVSFKWKDHRINLLDTPGHIDFTMEVEQSLGAVDGSVIILDGSAGVEAQTITVWSQSDRYELPKMIFVNKMDRQDADFNECVADVQTKLNALPLELQMPYKEKNNFKGVIDLLSLKKIVWDQKHQGQIYKVEEISDDEMFKKAREKRMQMIDSLSGHDDNLAEAIIAGESLENVDVNLILNAIRRLTLKRSIVPIIMGSAYKNIGVQLLIDSVINYLPAPNERNEMYNCFGDDFVGKVFKVTHDKQRGPLSLIRLYRGELKRGARIMTSSGIAEHVQRIYEPLADEYREIEHVSAGNVCVCTLKSTKTGDLLISNMTSLKNAQKRFKKNNESIDEEDDGTFLLEAKIPDAVYFCSIEPPSISYQSALDSALLQITREDPSLRVRYDESTMQTVLGGMGELHLEIIKSRLLTEYKIDADLGPLQIAYKETLEQKHRSTLKSEKEIAGSKQSVEIELTVDVLREGEEIFKVDNSPEGLENLKLIRPKFIYLVKKAAVNALDRGPKIGGQVVNVKIILHKLVIGRGTVESFIAAVTTQCIQKILIEAGSKLMEPMMAMQIVLPSDKVSQVITDLARRRSQIIDISMRGEDNKIIEVIAPLAELSGYSSVLRTITSGTASVSMQPHCYSLLSTVDENLAIRRAQGFE
ncbi:ribosome-releasing factor 2, mitochondrial isoform X3 [Chironomus tepperi]